MKNAILMSMVALCHTYAYAMLTTPEYIGTNYTPIDGDAQVVELAPTVIAKAREWRANELEQDKQITDLLTRSYEVTCSLKELRAKIHKLRALARLRQERTRKLKKDHGDLIELILTFQKTH